MRGGRKKERREGGRIERKKKMDGEWETRKQATSGEA